MQHNFATIAMNTHFYKQNSSHDQDLNAHCCAFALDTSKISMRCNFSTNFSACLSSSSSSTGDSSSSSVSTGAWSRSLPMMNLTREISSSPSSSFTFFLTQASMGSQQRARSNVDQSTGNANRSSFLTGMLSMMLFTSTFFTSGGGFFAAAGSDGTSGESSSVTSCLGASGSSSTANAEFTEAFFPLPPKPNPSPPFTFLTAGFGGGGACTTSGGRVATGAGWTLIGGGDGSGSAWGSGVGSGSGSGWGSGCGVGVGRGCDTAARIASVIGDKVPSSSSSS
mmetsp:Transcript_18503/g.35214  ORF Transcript_18503/g.35214 Transcript_18503/m.35214 type:complete len:281 (-) Transcript_18503:1985-2827(-)